MKKIIRIMIIITYLVIGAVLSILGETNIVSEYWGGFGLGLLGIGVILLIRIIRYSKDKKYKEKIDIENNDERNIYIAQNAWTVSGKIMTCVLFISSVVFKVIGCADVSFTLAMVACAMLVVYWITFYIMYKKY